MTTVGTMIPHSRPALDEREIRAATDVLRSGHIAQGEQVRQFEQAVADYMGLAGGAAVSSGTAALEVALRALGIGAGDEVILPSYVCAAPWLAVQRVGATARLVDIEPDTCNLDAGAARRALTPKTRAIIVPHLFGLPADLTALDRLGVPLIEDCAQTLGAREQGRLVGTVGVMTVCSFYATKLLCAGEGGMVLSRDRQLLERARGLREYDGAERLHPAATNLKMTDLQAAIGLAQLRRVSSFLERRAALARQYGDALAGSPAVRPSVPAGRTHMYYRYVVRVTERRSHHAGLAGAMAWFEDQGVQCRKPVFRPLHRYLGLDGFPASDEVDHTALSVPLYPALSDEEAAHIRGVLAQWR